MLLAVNWGRSCGLHLALVSPPSLTLPENLTSGLQRAGCAVSVHSELSPDLLGRADVLYVTRVQKERFFDLKEYDSTPVYWRICDANSRLSTQTPASAPSCRYEELKLHFIVTPGMLSHCKPSCVLMHPFPRCGEVDPACDADIRAAYFRQMENGL